MRRYTADQVRITVREGDRLLVSWRGDAFVPVKESFRAHFGRHRDAVYSGETKAWSLLLSRKAHLRDWLAQTCEPACIRWEGEPAGSRTHSRGRSSYHRYEHHGVAVAPALQQAYAQLHLLPSAPPEVVTAAHHALVRLHHPDTGHGDTERMAAINTARDVILRHLERRSA